MSYIINTSFKEQLSSVNFNRKIHMLLGENSVFEGFDVSIVNDEVIIEEGQCTIEGACIESRYLDEPMKLSLARYKDFLHLWVCFQYNHVARTVKELITVEDPTGAYCLPIAKLEKHEKNEEYTIIHLNRVKTLASTNESMNLAMEKIDEFDKTLDDFIKNQTEQHPSIAEVVEARGGEKSLKDRLDKADERHKKDYNTAIEDINRVKKEVQDARFGADCLADRLTYMMEDCERDKAELNSSITEIENEILEAKGEENETLADRLNKIDEVHSEDVKIINNNIDDINSDIAGINKEISDARGNSDTLLDELNSIKGTIESNDNEATSSINKIKKEIADARGSLPTLSDKLNSMEVNHNSDIFAINSELKDARAGEPKLVNRLNKMQEQSDSNTERIDELEDLNSVWKEYNGVSNVTINNSSNGIINDLVIKGMNINNLVINGKGEGIKMTNAYYKAWSDNNPLLKPNRTYTMWYKHKIISTDYTGELKHRASIVVTYEDNTISEFSNLYDGGSITFTLLNKNIKSVEWRVGRIGSTHTTTLDYELVCLEGEFNYKPFNSYPEYFASLGELEDNNIKIKSVGKNLCNKNHFYDQFYKNDISSNKHAIKRVVEDGRNCFKIVQNGSIKQAYKNKFKSNTPYTISFFCKQTSINNSALVVKYTDGSQIILYSEANMSVFKQFSITTSPNKQIDYIAPFWSDGKDIFIDEDTIQIEENKVATAYEKFKSSEVSINLPFNKGLKSIPRGVSDEIHLNKYKVIQKLNEYTFTGNENWTERSTDLPTSNFIKFQCSEIALESFKDYLNSEGKIICNNFIGEYCDDVNHSRNSIMGRANGDGFVIVVSKSRLSTPNVEGLKDYLKKNATTVVYELENPRAHKLKDFDLLRTFNNTSYLFLESSMTSNIEFKYAADRDASIEGTISSIELIKEHINNKKLEPIWDSNSGDRTIIVEDSNNGIIKDIVVKGRTLQNLYSDKHCNGGTLTDDGFRLFTFSSVGWHTVGLQTDSKKHLWKPLLKPNTSYTLIAEVAENTLSGTGELFRLNEPAKQRIFRTSVKLPNNFTGVFISKIITRDNEEFEAAYHGLYPCTTSYCTGGTIKIRYMIFEGELLENEVPSMYSDSIKSVGDQENNKILLKSTGKNIFNGVLELGTINSNGQNIASNNESRSRDFIEVFSDIITVSRNTAKGVLAIRCYDSNFNFIGTPSGGSIPSHVLSQTYTLVSNTKYIKFKTMTSDMDIEYQIEEGITKTNYDKYQECFRSIQIPFEKGLKSLPNGICDYYNGEEIIQNIGQYTINEKSTFVIGTAEKGATTTLFATYDCRNLVKTNGGEHGTDILCNTFASKAGSQIYSGSNDEEGIYMSNGGNIYFRIKDSSLSTPDINGFKNWLSSNPTTIFYHLKTPIIHKVKEEYLRSFNEKTYIINCNNISGNVSALSPMDKDSIIEGNTLGLDILNNKLDFIESETSNRIDEEVKKINTDLGNYLPLTGGTLTGNLTLLKKAVNPSFGTSIDGNSSAEALSPGLSIIDTDTTDKGYAYSYGTVLNVNAGSLARQYQLLINNVGRFSIRSSHTNNQSENKWGPWYKVYTELDKPTAAEVGARPSNWVPAWGDVTGKPSTFAPIIGTASNQAAAGNHTHDSISGSQITADIYNYANGILINTNQLSAQSTMVTVRIIGNGYGAGLPIDCTYCFYDYNADSAIMNPSGVATGVPITLSVFRHDGKLKMWFKQTVAYQSFKIIISFGNKGNVPRPTYSDAPMPTSGVTNKVDIVPKTFLKKSGDTLTGELILHTSGTKFKASSHTWIGGKTTNNVFTAVTGINGSEYYPIIKMNHYTGNISNIGVISNKVGFWGYLSSRTENGTDAEAYLDIGTNTFHAAKFSGNGASITGVNATRLNGLVENTASIANTIAKRDVSGDISVRLLKSEYANQSNISGAMAFRVNNSSDNYIRFCSDPAAVRTWLGAATSSHTHSYLPLSGGTLTGILKTNSEIHLNGTTIKMNKPNTTGGWARGIDFKSPDGATSLGAIGMYGTNETINNIYLGFGEGPYNGTNGLLITTTHLKFKNHNVYHAGNKPTAADVGARPISWVPAWGDITGKPSTFAPIIGTASNQAAAGNHNHDTVYLGKTATAASATKLATARTINGVAFDGTSNITITANPNSHTHDDRYYTESEINTKLNTKLNVKSSVVNIDTETGSALLWHRPSSSVGYPTLNSNAVGILSVNTHEGNYHTQLALDSYNNKLLLRSRHNTPWTNWIQVYTTQHKPTATDVGARPSSWVPAWGDVTGKPSTFAPIIGTASNQAAAGNHNHDTVYLGKTAKAADSSKLNGAAESTTSAINTIAKRDANGDINVRLLRSEYANQATISGAIAYRTNNSSDNYIRFCSDPAAIRTWLGAAASSHGTHVSYGGNGSASTVSRSDHTHDFISTKETSNWNTALTNGFWQGNGASNGPESSGWFWVYRMQHGGGYGAQIAVKNGGDKIYFRSQGSDGSGTWREVYHTAKKPTAADVGALPSSGGTLTGHLRMNSGLNMYFSNNYGIAGKDTTGSDRYMLFMDDSNRIHIGYSKINNVVVDATTLQLLGNIRTTTESHFSDGRDYVDPWYGKTCCIKGVGDAAISGWINVSQHVFKGWAFTNGNKYWVGISADDLHLRTYHGNSDLASGAMNLGSSNGRWLGLFVVNAVNVSSDIRKKRNVLSCNENQKLETFYDNLKPCSYVMRAGDTGRSHFGFVAQEVEEAMDIAGMSYKECAFLQKAPLDENGDEIKHYTLVEDPDNPGKYIKEYNITNHETDERIKDYDYALAYTELISVNTHFIQHSRKRITSLEEENKELKDKVSNLETRLQALEDMILNNA